MNQLRILSCGHALETRPKEWSYPAGGTIRQAIIAARNAGLVDELLVDADGRVEHGFNLHVVVAHPHMAIPAMVIPYEQWDIVRPKPGMALSIALRPTGGGGGGGGKSPLRIILTIVVMVASYYVGGAAAAAMNGYGTTAANIAAAVASTATSLLGATLLNCHKAPAFGAKPI